MLLRKQSYCQVSISAVSNFVAFRLVVFTSSLFPPLAFRSLEAVFPLFRTENTPLPYLHSYDFQNYLRFTPTARNSGPNLSVSGLSGPVFRPYPLQPAGRQSHVFGWPHRRIFWACQPHRTNPRAGCAGTVYCRARLGCRRQLTRWPRADALNRTFAYKT